MKQTICSECGRILESDFIFCPWCGQTRLNADDKASLEAVFAQLEQKQNEDRNRRLIKIGSRLNALEKELDILVLSNELSK